MQKEHRSLRLFAKIGYLAQQHITQLHFKNKKNNSKEYFLSLVL
jgi:hypothetical protein